MPTTSKIPVTPGAGNNVATFAFNEDGVTKEMARAAIGDVNGADIDLAGKLGATNETAPTTDIALSGLNGRLQRIAQQLTSLLKASTSAQVSYTCGTTSYAQYDAVGVGAGSAVLHFTGLVPIAGQVFRLSDLLVRYEDSVLQASQVATYRLYWFSSSPASALNDSSPFTFSGSAPNDWVNYLGYTDGPSLALPQSNALAFIGESHNIGQRLALTGTDVYAYLVYMGATTYTPIAKKFTITITGDPV